MLNGRQQSATTLGGLASGTNVSEVDLQKLIAIALTAMAGLVAVGMLTRAALLDRAARRKQIADAATETTDSYYDREFYRKLREGNVAQSPWICVEKWVAKGPGSHGGFLIKLGRAVASLLLLSSPC
jgi:hypothetical protein